MDAVPKNPSGKILVRLPNSKQREAYSYIHALQRRMLRDMAKEKGFKGPGHDQDRKEKAKL